MSKQRLLNKAGKAGISVDLNNIDFDEITLMSPHGTCFIDGSHCRVVAMAGPGFRKELWQDAIEDLNDLIQYNMPAEPCDQERCSAWVDGACEWWSA